MNTPPPGNNARTSGHMFLCLLALIALGLAGNYFKFSILNADFIFGSIFAMLALQLLGLGRGIVAAAIISSYTYLAWNHPYAMLTMTAEVAVVGWLISHRKINLVAADSIYWVAVGIPMGFLCFYFVSHMPPSNAMFLMTKQAINGVTNCVIARLVFTGYSMRSNTPLISIRETVSNLMIFFALFAGLIMLTVGSRTDFAETDRRIRTMMIGDSRGVTDSIEDWLDDRQVPIVNLAGMASTIFPEDMQVRLDQARTSDKNFLRIALMDKEATAIAYSPSVDELGRSTIGRTFADRPYIPQLKQKLQPMLSEVIESRFGSPEPVAIMLAPVISKGEYGGYVAGILNLNRIRNILEIHSTGRDIQYTLQDRNGNVIITNRPDLKAMIPFSRGKGTLNRLDEAISQWIPQLPPRTSTIELWGKSLYVVESPVGKLAEWKLILEEPVAPFQKMLYDRYTGRFSVLLMVVLALLALAEFLSRRIVSTTEQLGVITLDLPAKLEAHQKVVWPESAMLETNHLIRNFRKMSDSLLAKFVENRLINESLEQLVEARTNELKRSEQKYRLIVENTHDVIYQTDMEGRVVFASPSSELLLGYTPEALLGRRLSELYAFPEERTRFLKLLTENGSVTDFEAILTRKDGSRVWLSTNARLLTDEEGKFIGVEGITRDISARKETEDSLRESEARYRYLVENIEDLICTHDLQGNLLFVSSGPAHLLGYAPADMVGTNLRSYLAPEVRDRFDEYLAAILKEGRASGLMLVQSSSGEKRIWEYRNTLRTETGAEPLVLGLASDVTERKRSEDALRESQERYQELFNETKDGVFVTSREGQLIEANQAYFDIFGYSKEEIIGGDVRVLYSNPSDREQLVKLMEHKGFVKNYPLNLKTKDGEEVGCLITSSLRRKQDGTIIGYHGIIRDRTEQMNLQKQLLQAQKMEAIGTLAGGVAHDFNNILQVALGYSELILADEGLPRRYRADLLKIRESAGRGADLVQRLLTFSRKTDINPKPLNLNHRITEMRKMVERTIPKMIGIELLLGEDLATISADATQVDQVLMNLAVNARDAMPEGGKLIVETENVVLDEEYARSHLDAEPGSYVLLTVTDTGKGMDKETLEHIFEPFYTTKAAGEGTGLGLAMVHGIVQQHGGHIRCYSEPGEGTTFKIYFPAVASGEEPEETSARPLPRGGAETILLVDDEEFILDLGSRILAKAGYKVIRVSAGKEALKVYQQRSDEISLVVLDLIMPEMGGKECLKSLLNLDAAVKVVIASGYSANGPTKDALAGGAMGFVNKPYDIRQMLEVVRQVLDAE